jgi:hypothetical protein
MAQRGRIHKWRSTRRLGTMPARRSEEAFSTQGETGRRYRVDQAEQKGWEVHGGENAQQKKTAARNSRACGARPNRAGVGPIQRKSQRVQPIAPRKAIALIFCAFQRPNSTAPANAFDLFIDLRVLGIFLLDHIVPWHVGSLRHGPVYPSSCCATSRVTRRADGSRTARSAAIGGRR